MSAQSKGSFFKQSGWMVIATFVGGAFMTLVHSVARKMGSHDYSTFVSLLRLLIILSIPSSALQTVFAQQAAAATNEEKERQLAATTCAILFWTFALWLVAMVVIIGFFGPVEHALKISNPVALFLTMGVGLTSLWI